ncbi:hypothetical protein BGV72_29865 [Burkholderia ubonensis]|nr:hypothetical protein BGV72_29865 [Burkholderia ubonensis]
MPDPVLGKPRRVTSVIADGICFDPKGPGGEDKRIFFWPEEPKDGFLGMLANECETLTGFVDDDTFIVDYQIYYSVFRLDT